MRSTELSLERYDTDKVAHGYLQRYDQIFGPWVDKKITLLELGVRRGGSLLLWRDYFPQGTIVGVDIRPVPGFVPPDRVHLFQGSQADRQFLSSVAERLAPAGFDIVIDDASHVGELTKIGFWHLFDHHLKPGGLYVIEDWGTGYWADWPDGRSLDLDDYTRPDSGGSIWSRAARRLGWRAPMPGHNYGMVGLVKQLVDEQAANDVTRVTSEGTATRSSKFARIVITESIVFVEKAARRSDPA